MKNKIIKNKQTLVICTALILIVLMSVNYVSAYKSLCLTKGQKLPPNFAKPRYECKHDSCQVCTTDNFFPTDLRFCNNLPNCNAYNPGNDSGGVLDTQPPVLTVNSPNDNSKFNTKYVLFDLKSNELASFYYMDNSKGAYSKLSSLVTSFSKSISFKDGLQNITIKAVDLKGNDAFKTVSFYVDSTKPKISKTLPGKGFANGKFEVWFTEANPVTVTLDYGNSIKGRRTANVPISSCTIDVKGNYYCNVSVSLTDYNNQDIDYNFKVTDVVGNYVISKPVTLKVDSAVPVITNSPIYNVSGKYVTFNLNINEANFDKVTYIDNSLLRPSWKSLCTSLKNGMCQKKITFSKGTHNIDVKVSDKAGNQVIQRIIFDIDY